MSSWSKTPNSNDEKKALEELEEPDGQGPREAPTNQGLKTPPRIEVGEASGEWTRGGGSDPNETKKRS